MDSRCPICFYQVTTDQSSYSPPCNCNYIFHLTCIKHWFDEKQTCPLCRQPTISLHHQITKDLSEENSSCCIQ